MSMMCDFSVSKSSKSVVQKPLVKARGREIVPSLACPICKKLCKDAIAINRCNHTFCEKCIYEKVEAVGGLKACPYCYDDLSSYSPNDYLRPNITLRNMVDKMRANMERDGKYENPYQLITYNETCESTTFQMDENNDGEILKKKRSTRKKTHNFPSSKENGMKMVKSEIGIGNETRKNLVSGEKTSDEIDHKKINENAGVHLDKFESFWFILSPQKDKKAHSYPKLTRPYINVKNGDLSTPVSVLHKYLAKKLTIEKEDEIEVCFFGKPIIKALTLRDLYESWIECVSKAPPSHYKYVNPVCLSTKKLVMELTYRKNIKDEAHPSTLNIKD